MPKTEQVEYKVTPNSEKSPKRGKKNRKASRTEAKKLILGVLENFLKHLYRFKKNKDFFFFRLFLEDPIFYQENIFECGNSKS